MERVGMIGAMPMGGRWRSQGYIDGNTKYLGTYDSEEEAHKVFMREKDRVQAEREAAAVVEVERILAGPTYVYEGGKGRGAALNGIKFKIVEAHGPHQAVVVPLDESGVPEFSNQTKVSLAYLTQEPEQPAAQAPAVRVEFEREPDIGDVPEGVWNQTAPPSKSAAVTIDPTTVSGIKADVLRFATRSSRHDVMWALEFVEKHVRGDAAKVLSVLMGQAGIEQQLEWLRANTNISSDFIRDVERQVTSGLFMDDTARAAARVLHKEYPESFNEPAGYLSEFFTPEE
jgi:hypothetical protein